MLADSRQTERQLAELSSLYRTLPVALAFLDPDLRLMRCNDPFADLFENRMEPRTGRPLHDVMPALAGRLEPLCRTVCREGTPIVAAEIEDPSSKEPTTRVWLVSCHRVTDDDGAVQGVSLMLQDIAAARWNEQSIRKMTIGLSTAGGVRFFPTLAEHMATALDADVVIIARLTRYPGQQVLTIAAVIDGHPVDATECQLEGSPWEAALKTDLWLSTDATQVYGTLHPRLQDINIEGCLIMALRDSMSAPRGFVAALSRRPFKNIDAAAMTLKVYGVRAAAELERRRSEDENLSLVTELSMSVRELSMLHVVTRILQQDELVSVSEWLAEVADAIRRLWPRPETVAVRATLGSFATSASIPDHVEWTHRAGFSVADGGTGAVEIAYLDHESRERANILRPGFLDSIAEMLKTAIDRRLILVALRQSEERYRSVVENQSDLVCRFLPDTTLTFVNDAYCRFFKRRREELIGTRFIEFIPPKDRETAMAHIDALARGAQPHVYEHAVLMPDGRVGRQQWIDHAITSHDGRIDELQGIGRDITGRWLAEEALRVKEASLREAYQRIRSLAQRLILAQEAERTEIARDLHDDVGQQLAALSIGLSIVETRLSDRPDVGSGVASLRQIANGLADKVRSTSHALHPGVLKHAGLSAALASYCETIASQHAISVAFEPEGLVDEVVDEVALCLYRVVQQALRNVVMHAHASRATVTLTRDDRQVVLLVADDGRGFDPKDAHVQGIGLLSMEERVRLINGTFTVDSTPGGGSLLRIEIPTLPA